MFDCLRKIGLKLPPQKCQFACPEVLYLGHTISAKGISPNSEKVQAVQEFKAPVNVKGVREFLGITGYYQRFVPNFSKVAALSHEAGCSICLDDPMSTVICEAQGAS